jgi:hypothetical protein
MTPEQLAYLKARVTEAVRARGGVQHGARWTFRCPNGDAHEHGDRTPSAQWEEARGMFTCFGCSQRGGAKALAAWLGIPLPPPPDRREKRRWTIRDAEGRPVAVHIRLEPGRHGKSKECVWELPDGRPGLGGQRARDLPLYGTHTLAPLPPQSTVVATEGEPPTDALRARGIAAVGTVTGASTIPSDDVLSVLVGYDVVCWPDADIPGRTHMSGLTARLRALGGTVRLLDPWPGATDGRDAANVRGSTEELRALIGTAAPENTTVPAKPAPPPVGVLIAEVEPEAVDWHWHPRLPKGKLVLLDGDPDEGKSTIALDFAARLSAGAPMPLETVGRPPAGVVVLSAEDGLADTIRPRLEAAGADLSRIVSERLDVLPTLDDAGIAHIHALIARVDAVFVVLDPLMAFVPDAVDTHKDHHSRRLLRKLAALAEESRATVLVLRHLRKASGQRPKDAGGGSVAYTAAARVVLLAAPDPRDETRKVLARVKGNLAAPFPALAYRLSAPDGVVRVEWLTETTHTAAELLQEPADDEERSAGEEAEVWLRDALAKGQRRADVTVRAARAAGISERTLRRARKRLEIRSEKQAGSLDGPWYWVPPWPATPKMAKGSEKVPKDSEDGQDPKPKSVAPFGGLGHLSGGTAEDVEVF